MIELGKAVGGPWSYKSICDSKFARTLLTNVFVKISTRQDITIEFKKSMMFCLFSIISAVICESAMAPGPKMNGPVFRKASRWNLQWCM